MKIEYSKRIGTSKVSHLRDAIRTFSYVFILTSLFQPYRLFLIIILSGLSLNFAVMMFAVIFNMTQALQIGLHIMASLSIIVGSIAINTYSSSKKYLDQLHGKGKYDA
jgi:small-conductance mechanosensitive channel